MGTDKKFHFTGKNYAIFAAAFLLMGAGYYMLSIGPHDSFWSLTLAPVIIVFSLAVVFPYGIIKNFKKNAPVNEQKKLDNGSE